jgi:hypothetical protein
MPSLTADTMGSTDPVLHKHAPLLPLVLGSLIAQACTSPRKLVSSDVAGVAPALDLEQPMGDDCLWSRKEATALCKVSVSRDDGFKDDLAFLGTKAERIPIVEHKALQPRKETDPPEPQPIVPEPSREHVRHRIVYGRYRLIDAADCVTLDLSVAEVTDETKRPPVVAAFAHALVRLRQVDHGTSCGGGRCGIAKGIYEVACKGSAPTYRRVLTVLGHSIATVNKGEVCLLDGRYVLIIGTIAGRNEENYLGERNAVLVDLTTECDAAVGGG